MRLIGLTTNGERICLILAMVLQSFLTLQVVCAQGEETKASSTVMSIPQMIDDLWIIIALLLVIVILLAAILVVTKIILMIFPPSNNGKANQSYDDGCKSIRWIIGLILLLLIAILAAILWSGLIGQNGSLSPESSIWAAIIIIAVVFLLLIYMGCAVDGSLDQGEMRRAIAGTFVLGFTILIFFLALHPIKNNELVTAYLQMVGVIIGFYFGAKTALAGTSSGNEGLAIEFVEVSEDKKKLILTLRNKGDNKLVVDKVYITGKGFTKVFEISAAIDPKASTKTDTLTLDKELNSGSVITIKVVTSTGLVDEREHTCP